MTSSGPHTCLRTWQGLISLMIWVLAIHGCGSDAEYHRIDFSEKMQVEHPENEASSPPRLRVAVAAMISPRETLSYYNALIDYIGNQTGYEMQIVQRKTYGEINALFPKGQVDLAFVCTGPYAVGQSTYGFEGLATPIIRGEPYYYSYLIVHKDSPFQNLTDLKGFVFAFTDPESNTGTLVPNYWLLQIDASPTFFKNITYTYSHDNSIMAVAKGLVDGAAVDGHLWEFYHRHNPFYTRQTRIIKKSQPFGSPPMVVSKFLADELKSEIKDVVLSMHNQLQGKKILDELMIDRFVPVDEKWYRPVRHMHTKVALAGRTHAQSQP